jgi:hypothetical protein
VQVAAAPLRHHPGERRRQALLGDIASQLHPRAPHRQRRVPVGGADERHQRGLELGRPDLGVALHDEPCARSRRHRARHRAEADRLELAGQRAQHRRGTGKRGSGIEGDPLGGLHRPSPAIAEERRPHERGRRDREHAECERRERRTERPAAGDEKQAERGEQGRGEERPGRDARVERRRVHVRG